MALAVSRLGLRLAPFQKANVGLTQAAPSSRSWGGRRQEKRGKPRNAERDATRARVATNGSLHSPCFVDRPPPPRAGQQDTATRPAAQAADVTRRPEEKSSTGAIRVHCLRYVEINRTDRANATTSAKNFPATSCSISRTRFAGMLPRGYFAASMTSFSPFQTS